ncbi:hypothetical protein JTB14_022804 [Gonioctena quinquepunctata]|nr:hypothetical protein JTB14_022804 [Gonioctena quinquepunctata]
MAKENQKKIIALMERGSNLIIHEEKLISLVCMSYCVALDDPKSARILKYDFDNEGTGFYRYSFDTSDGISKQETGELVNAGRKDESVKVSGSFSYPGPDGIMYEVRYTADDQGFHPEGDHIMVPPFVPWIHHHHEHDHDDFGSSGVATEIPKYTSGYRLLDSRTSSRLTTEYLPSSTSDPITAQPVHDNSIEDLILSTPRPPQPDLIFHSAPAENTRFSNFPKFTTPIEGNNIDDIPSSTSEPLKIDLFFHSTPEDTTENIPASSSPEPIISEADNSSSSIKPSQYSSQSISYGSTDYVPQSTTHKSLVSLLTEKNNIDDTPLSTPETDPISHSTPKTPGGYFIPRITANGLSSSEIERRSELSSNGHSIESSN